MNWKLVATLIVGAVLVSACGASQQEAASPTSETRGAKEEAAPPAAEGAGAAAPAPAGPGMAPAAKDPAGAKKDVVLHE